MCLYNQKNNYKIHPKYPKLFTDIILCHTLNYTKLIDIIDTIMWYKLHNFFGLIYISDINKYDEQIYGRVFIHLYNLSKENCNDLKLCITYIDGTEKDWYLNQNNGELKNTKKFYHPLTESYLLSNIIEFTYENILRDLNIIIFKVIKNSYKENSYWKEYEYLILYLKYVISFIDNDIIVEPEKCLKIIDYLKKLIRYFNKNRNILTKNLKKIDDILNHFLI